MAENGGHAMRNSIIATVVGGLILAAVPTVRGWVAAGWNVLAGWAQQLWLWLGSTYETPVWLLAVLTLFSAAFIIPLLIRVLRPSREPTFSESYTSDSFFGAVWRWRYLGSGIDNLWCFCPGCDGQLVYEEARNDGMRPGSIGIPPHFTSFSCERCRTERCRIEGDREHALHRVQREIDRKIRTGEWKPRLPTQ
jgi:hypothetical protein